jgi:septum formation protein
VSAAEIDAYVASGEPLDRAGAYAIQGGAGAFLDRLEGSLTAVIGLPTERIVEVCSGLGARLV